MVVLSCDTNRPRPGGLYVIPVNSPAFRWTVPFFAHRVSLKKMSRLVDVDKTAEEVWGYNI